MEALDHSAALGQGMVDIGRAAAASGVSVKMIRHYESIGILPPAVRTSANYRVYGTNDVHTLRFIRRARDLGFSMDEIRELLALWRERSRPSRAVKSIARGRIGELKRKIAELEAMVKALEHLAHHCHGDQRPECPILEELAR
jgi:Cu(I)-responsive transcriptional regulator